MGENKIDILRKRWGFPLAIIFGMIVWFMPQGHGLTPQGHHALALLICTQNVGQVIKRLIWNEFGILPDSFLLVLA